MLQNLAVEGVVSNIHMLKAHGVQNDRCLTRQVEASGGMMMERALRQVLLTAAGLRRSPKIDLR